jgi:hypothetical protein
MFPEWFSKWNRDNPTDIYKPAIGLGVIGGAVVAATLVITWGQPFATDTMQTGPRGIAMGVTEFKSDLATPDPSIASFLSSTSDPVVPQGGEQTAGAARENVPPGLEGLTVDNYDRLLAAMREWKRSQDSAMRAGFAGVQMRINKVMDVQLQKEMSKLEQRLLVLATVGSTAPFIGLFGTVWGIMNSFRAIGISKNTNLAVVAPGLAEALFATALGLIAAIPAVMFYNKFSSDIGKIAAKLENFADEFSAIISRQLDERM